MQPVSVTLYARVWIEIPKPSDYEIHIDVTLYARVWIEIKG